MKGNGGNKEEKWEIVEELKIESESKKKCGWEMRSGKIKIKTLEGRKNMRNERKSGKKEIMTKKTGEDGKKKALETKRNYGREEEKQ